MQLINWLKYYFKFSEQKIDWSNIKNVLIIRNDHIGDLCLTLPVIYAIKNFQHSINIYLLVTDYTFELVSDNPYVNIISYALNEDKNSIIEKINKNQYDITFLFTTTRFNGELIKEIKSKYKIGYAYKWFNILNCNRYVFLHRQKPPVHETQFCFKFLETLGMNIDKENAIKETKIYIKEETKLRMEKYIKELKFKENLPIIGIHPGDNKSAYNWRFKRYLELAKELMNNYNILIIFGIKEKNLINEIPTEILEKIRIIKGDLNLKELSYLISKFDLFISGSSGPMHIAGLMGTKTLSLFSHKPSHSYFKWHPIKNEYYIIESKKDSTGDIMESITVEEVKSKVNKILKAY